jgi:osmoprotectant transport system permease protein
VIFDLQWVQSNAGYLARLVGEHALLAILPVLAAFLLAVPLGYLIFRTGRAAGAVLTLFGVVYAIPFLALFVAVPLLFGIELLSPINVGIALTIYSVALLVATVVDGLRSVPTEVKQAATAAGYSPLGRLFRIELPLAMPRIFAGLRAVTVSNIALVSVAAVIGGGALGELFDEGLAGRLYTPAIVGLVLTILLAVLADVLIRIIQRGSLPWARKQQPA